MHSSDNHRHCFLLKGSVPEVLSDFLRLCEPLTEPLICAHDITPYQQLASSQNTSFQTCTFKQARQELGSSHDAILVDLTHGVSASALAILAGTVRGNGVFAIALPEGDWLSIVDQDLPRYLPWPYESKQIDSSFKRFLLARLENSTSPFTAISSKRHSPHQTPLPVLECLNENAPLTQEQTAAQACLLDLKAKSYVLIAPRGRGKSTLLGDSLAKLQQAGKKVALTAANQTAITTLKKRYESLVAESDFEFPFIAPDALLSMDAHWDVLLVDEASSIPLPMLIALNEKADHCLFSTTDYGYEGAGKGFGIRFCTYLESQSDHQRRPLERLTLRRPIRWGENDPLENWINDCFFLAPEPNTETPCSALNNDPFYAEYRAIKGAEWLTQATLLSQTFQLLVSAHYQTSPDNLRWVLDDPSVSTYISMQDNRLHSVAIVTEEGPLPDELSVAVLQGTRRPRGHLIPQSLLAHEGIEDAGQYRYWRISRIATQANEQNKGLASELLNHLEIRAKSTIASERCDFLCTSFAATLEVVAFWLKNGFVPVRLGTTKDQASGSYSLMMVKPLTDEARQQASRWHRGYLANLAINLPRDYADIDAELALKLTTSCLNETHHNIAACPQDLTEKDNKDLSLFVYHHRPYLTIRAQLTRLVVSKISHHQLTTTHPDYPLLHAVISQPANRIDFSAFHLNTKKQVDKHLKSVIKGLID
ncbi:tRNA(Met) cytidine acetyltransferase TmcA [Marinomonas flavescens]|uniref:tRNA(Met) cytidine acetyltransferase TmcA n=1 Tax=Marinomonas flavescens TaxID=2529379 RepID=UPI0010556805|nr:GNAT family N-acetyltransferase [Marinomonas flavescens]